MPDRTPYDEAFFAHLEPGTLRSAKAIVPVVLDLLPETNSVVDVGCGTGAFLNVVMDRGIDDVVGIDGDYVDRQSLLFPASRFFAFDLRDEYKMDRSFDLVLCLEVAEHLPAECADRFIQCLSRLGPAVLFSAAIPQQGGVGHLNEQWPSYWAEIFQSYGFVPIDCMRHRVWENKDIEFWYAQNMVLYVRTDKVASLSRVAALPGNPQTCVLPLVHPRAYQHQLQTFREAQAAKWIPCVRQRAVAMAKTSVKVLTGTLRQSMAFGTQLK